MDNKDTCHIMLLLFRKNTRLLKELSADYENYRQIIIYIKNLISKMSPELYGVIKTICTDYQRFEVKEMPLEVNRNGGHYFYYIDSNGNSKAYKFIAYWQLNDPNFIPFTVFDNKKEILFTIDGQETFANGTKIFTDSDSTLLYGIVKVLVQAQKREEQILAEQIEIKRQEEESQKKHNILSNYI